MITPQDLGLPEKFQYWRINQYEAVEAIAKSNYFAYLLDAPTGIGKSLIGIAVHKLLKKRTIYITRTKQLQDQILKEFPETVKTVKGRENYPCTKHSEDFPSFTAAECTDTEKNPCKLKDRCSYRIAKAEALNSAIVVLNNSYYLTEVNGPGKFDRSKLLIVDEVDSIESDLMNYIQFEVNGKQLERLNINPPEKPDDFQSWVNWAEVIRPTILEKARNLEEQFEMVDERYWTDIELDMVKMAKRLRRFNDKILFFGNEVDESTWIFNYKEEKEWWQCSFKPILISKYATKYLWSHVDSVLGMSGTIFMPKVVANDIGLTDWEYSSLNSPFPIENRQIFYYPIANLTKKTMDDELPKLLQGVFNIINKYPNGKVLIHTVSYKIRDYLLENLPEDRLITHSKEDRTIRLEEFKNSNKPLIMLSPSFDRGVDLPDEDCRCIIICKIPYLDLGDPQIQKRVEVPGGRQWYLVRTAQTLVQMSGRAVRSSKDYCDTYILDRQFSSFIKRMGYVLPKWWLNAVTRLEVEN